MTLAPEVLKLARCAQPKYLSLVDAAFDRPGGEAQRRMESEVCSRCPIWDACLRDALDHGEHGPWGGTNRRRRNATAPHGPTYNLRGIHVGEPVGSAVNMLRLQGLGVTAAQVKAWAGRTGGGTPSVALIVAYAEAHQLISA